MAYQLGSFVAKFRRGQNPTSFISLSPVDVHIKSGRRDVDFEQRD
jgi:hypothetical protein